MVTYTCVAIPNVPNWWPAKPQDSSLDYALDITATIDPAEDHIVQVAASVAPSGAGEMVLSGLAIDGDTLLLTTSQGAAGRVYDVKLVVTMANARVYTFFVNQGVPPGLPGNPIPLAPTPGYSTPLVVNRPPPRLNFSQAINSSLRTWGWN